MPEATNFTRPRPRAPVPGAIFSPTRRPPFALFTATGAEARPDGHAASEDRAVVYVSRFDFAALIDYLHAHLVGIVRDAQVPIDARAWVMHRVLLAEAAAIIEVPGSIPGRELLAATRELARLLASDARAFPELNALLGGPYWPAAHAVATAVVAVALASADGVDDPERLTGIALGGLFADTGKLDVAADALMRRGPLTVDEWERMLLHPRRSVERLRDAGVLLAQAQHGALHHHERWDGEGYPDGRRGTDIPIEARYIAIADAFSAMTADRPFRPRRDAFDAVTEMVADGAFEPRLLRVFVPLLAA